MSEVNADGVLLNPGQQLTRLVLHKTDVLSAEEPNDERRAVHVPGGGMAGGLPHLPVKH